MLKLKNKNSESRDSQIRNDTPAMTVIDNPPSDWELEDDFPEIIIQPSRGWRGLKLGDLWNYRELLFFLALRDIRVRYKQTIFGAAWAILQPLFTMIVFSIFFGKLAKIPSEGVPYPIFSYCALVPWMYFANSLTQSTSSLVEHERIITKVYFPRLLLPMAPVLAGFLDFAISFSVLVGMLLFYGYKPTTSILSIPFFFLLAALSSLGAGLWLSALNVRYRDVRYVTPFLIQFWLFISPIAYPSSLLPEKWQILYGINPVAGVIEGFRWALLGDRQVPMQLILVSIAATLVLLVSGLFFFRWMEKSFADVL
jgi:lipopolysaccharide transport system permease protein